MFIFILLEKWALKKLVIFDSSVVRLCILGYTNRNIRTFWRVAYGIEDIFGIEDIPFGIEESYHLGLKIYHLGLKIYHLGLKIYTIWDWRYIPFGIEDIYHLGLKIYTIWDWRYTYEIRTNGNKNLGIYHLGYIQKGLKKRIWTFWKFFRVTMDANWRWENETVKSNWFEGFVLEMSWWRMQQFSFRRFYGRKWYIEKYIWCMEKWSTINNWWKYRVTIVIAWKLSKLDT